MAKYLLYMSLVCFFVARIQANACNFNPTHLVKHGHELKEPAFWETKTKDVVKCAQSCIRRKKCKLFNFNVNTGLCQLNEKTGTPSKADSKLVYSAIGDWPSQVDPHCNNNLCSEDEICIPGNSIGAPICAYNWSKLAPTTIPSEESTTTGPPTTTTTTTTPASTQVPTTIGPTTEGPTTTTATTTTTPAPTQVLTTIGPTTEGPTTTTTTTTTTPAPTQVCDDGWIPFEDKCYLLGETAQNYDDAKKFCATSGSHLVHVETKEEDDFLKKNLMLRDYSLCSDSNSKCCFWNALYQPNDNGHETWTPSGQELTYKGWVADEPSDPSERCTIFVCFRDFSWADVKCERLFLPLCEK